MAGRPYQSRINRIYIKEDLIPFTWNWNIVRTGINTNHLLVATTILNLWQPQMGTRRYVMPINLLKEQEFLARIKHLGMKLESDLNSISDN